MAVNIAGGPYAFALEVIPRIAAFRMLSRLLA